MRRSYGAVPAALALLWAALPATAEEIYRSVDEHGRVIFSDKPSDGAKPVEVRPANTMSQPAPTAPTADKADAQEPSAAARPYTLVAIVEPADGATVVDQLGAFTVRFSTEPPRQADHPVRLLMDGEPAGTNVAEGVRVSGSTRGDHLLQLQVLDRDGRLLGQSGTVRVLVVRPGPDGSTRRPGHPG